MQYFLQSYLIQLANRKTKSFSMRTIVFSEQMGKLKIGRIQVNQE